MRSCYHDCMVKREHVVSVAFRLEESKHRQLRMALASEGLTLQKALEQSVDQVIARSRYRDETAYRPVDLMGILANTGVMELRDTERSEELDRDRKRL